MIIRLLKAKLRSLKENKSGATLIEFAFVGGIFILALLSVIELFIFYLYKTTMESAITKGLEDTAFTTALVNGGLISTNAQLRNATNILDVADIENNIPTFYQSFIVAGSPTFNITGGGIGSANDYNAASGGIALSGHTSWRVQFTADWDPLTPYLRVAGTIPIEIIVHYNDY